MEGYVNARVNGRNVKSQCKKSKWEKQVNTILLLVIEDNLYYSAELCINVLNLSATIYVNFSCHVSGMTYYRCGWNYSNSGYI